MASGCVISPRTIAAGNIVIQGALRAWLLMMPIVQSQEEEEGLGNGGLSGASKWIWFTLPSLGCFNDGSFPFIIVL